MDAVRAKIRQLGGEVLIDSTPGAGTTAQIRLPLTLAIVSALQVEVAGAPFAFPIDRIERTLRLSDGTVRSVAGRRMLVLDDDVLPLVDGAEAFKRAPSRRAPVRGDHPGAGPPDWRSPSMTSSDSASSSPARCRRSSPTSSPCPAGATLADARIALIVDCDALVGGALATTELRFAA